MKRVGPAGQNEGRTSPASKELGFPPYGGTDTYLEISQVTAIQYNTTEHLYRSLTKHVLYESALHYILIVIATNTAHTLVPI